MKLLIEKGCLGKILPETEDIESKWESIGNAYLPDGVREIAAYPTVSLGWMMYVGMAVANYWDKDWAKHSQVENLYESIRDIRGFDEMDEAIREEILDQTRDGEEYQNTEKLVRECAQFALNKIRHENIEPQSPAAFKIYVASLHTLYRIGAAVQLYKLGYKMQRMN